jgi:hypothetical protein
MIDTLGFGDIKIHGYVADGTGAPLVSAREYAAALNVPWEDAEEALCAERKVGCEIRGFTIAGDWLIAYDDVADWWEWGNARAREIRYANRDLLGTVCGTMLLLRETVDNLSAGPGYPGHLTELRHHVSVLEDDIFELKRRSAEREVPPEVPDPGLRKADG